MQFSNVVIDCFQIIGIANNKVLVGQIILIIIYDNTHTSLMSYKYWFVDHIRIWSKCWLRFTKQIMT